jgi:hypothetical protein
MSVQPLAPVAADPIVRKRHTPWRRLIVIGALFLLVPAAALVTLYLVISSSGGELKEAIAEADQLDPNWRLYDVEAGRRQVADKDNSALHILKITKQMPSPWATSERFLELFQEPFPPQAQLNDEQIKALRTELAAVVKLLGDARKMKDLPSGRFPIEYSCNYISTRYKCQEARSVAGMLWYDTLMRAQEGAVDACLDNCRGIINCGRAVGDEPTLISQLMRIVCRTMAVTGIERALAQGQPSEAALAAVQQLLEQDEPEPLLLVGLRGERGGYDHLMEGLQNGEIKPADFIKTVGEPEKMNEAQWAMLFSPVNLSHERATLLRYMTKLVEAAKLPTEKQPQRFAEIEASIKGAPLFVRLLAPASSKVADATLRSLAEVRCAIVAVAAERYRLKHGDWPETLAKLVEARYLKRVPLDPYDGNPLRWKRLPDGVVVYSLGPGGKDNGGNLNRHNPIAPDSDTGVKLWDVPLRRQAAMPPRPRGHEHGPPDDR